MNKPGIKKNTENTNQQQAKNDGTSSGNIKQPFTSAQFRKVKKIFEPPSKQSGVKKKFSITPAQFQKIKKVFETSSNQSGKGNVLTRIHQTKMPMPMPIPNQPQGKQIQKKTSEKTQKKTAEQTQKKTAEQAQKKTAEQAQQKTAEQTQKKTAEQTQKQTAEQQNFISPEIEEKDPEEHLDIVRARTPTLMPVNMLSNLPYSKYSQAVYSQQPFYNISGYGFNSYSGTVKGYNEDTIKVILNYPKDLIVNNKKTSPHISYFGIFDGHGGDACSNFLKDNLDSFIFNSKYFPANPIQAIKDAFKVAEETFMKQAIDSNSNNIDKSGSCACVILIINDTLYAINLGDSRALLSSNSGQTLRQITRDHKPNDPIEKNRIENAGAQIYYANTIMVDEAPVVLKESDFGEGFTFPYRINPGGMSVSLIL